MTKLFLSVLLFGIFTDCLILAQSTKIDLNKRKLFYQKYHRQQINSNQSCESGTQMLKYAQDNYEKALANNVLGECMYNAGDFLQSVRYLREAQNNIQKTDSLREELRILNILIISYRRAGFIVESDENWKKLKSIVKKNPGAVHHEDLLYIEAKIYDIDQEYCKAAEVRKKYLNLVNKAESNEEMNNRYRFAVASQLCYVQIKCGIIDEAKQSLNETETLLSKIKIKEPIQLLEFYFMNKALLQKYDGKNDEAKKNFDSAFHYVLLAKTNSVTKLILSERLNSSIDTTEDQLKFSKIVSRIANTETSITKKLALEESLKNKSLLAEKERKMRLHSALSVIILLVLIGFVIYYFKKKKKDELRYQSIIAGLQNKVIDNSIPKATLSTDKVIMPEETEQKIVKNLLNFEKQNLFTTKGISIAQMAVILKTNTKYLNYILKKHRNSDFNNYINTYRINYIIKELHDKPHLLHYKISVISELCGYQTHSQFASIFKSKKGLSPSTYINFLLQEKKKK
ncbi:helix-turn-helix domain-containing protein [Chryseobacterium sp.]|uniref:helix-turn-helix domain-containing protein n=1 Tax=Chryseobacterium sp. TaxID=1871047 RepID=UPI00388F8E71